MSNQKLPFVSVCIPVYNGENYLIDCIKSALAQNYSNFELLIVDNCSTDRTAAIVNDLNDSRVRYVRNETNIGSIGNFNKCIELAKGKYCLLLPHDDLLLPGSIVKFVKVLEDPLIGFVYSSIRVINEDGEVTHNKVNHDTDRTFSSEEVVIDIIENFHPIQLAMAHTAILRRLGGFDIRYALLSDVHLWLKVAFDGWKAFYHKEPLSCHRTHVEQGQVAFTKTNLEVLSKHYGKKLDKTFWIKNSYNRLFLKLSRFLLSESERVELDVSHVKIELLKIFAHSHLRSLLAAAINRNGFVLKQELMMTKLIIKQYSLYEVALYYPVTVFERLKKRLSHR